MPENYTFWGNIFKERGISSVGRALDASLRVAGSSPAYFFYYKS